MEKIFDFFTPKKHLREILIGLFGAYFIFGLVYFIIEACNYSNFSLTAFMMFVLGPVFVGTLGVLGLVKDKAKIFVIPVLLILISVYGQANSVVLFSGIEDSFKNDFSMGMFDLLQGISGLAGIGAIVFFFMDYFNYKKEMSQKWLQICLLCLFVFELASYVFEIIAIATQGSFSVALLCLILNALIEIYIAFLIVRYDIGKTQFDNKALVKEADKVDETKEN